MIRYEKLSTREMAYIATFGTLWGGSEITLGMVLHNFHLPLTGLLLTFIGAIIALVTVKLTNRKRAIIYTAIIAAVLKLLSFTTIKIFPFLGIIMSALIAQIVISVLSLNFLSFILSAALMCCWPFIQSLLFYTLAYTPKFFDFYQEFLNKIGIPFVSIWFIVLLLFLFHFLIGSIAGVISWYLAKAIEIQVKVNDNSL